MTRTDAEALLLVSWEGGRIRVVCPACALEVLGEEGGGWLARSADSEGEAPCGECGGSGFAECGRCSGSGSDPDGSGTCPECGGAGSRECDLCEGEGSVPCALCGGRGWLLLCEAAAWIREAAEALDRELHGPPEEQERKALEAWERRWRERGVEGPVPAPPWRASIPGEGRDAGSDG